MVFQLHEKNPQIIIFFRKKKCFRGKKNGTCNDCRLTKWWLNSPVQEEEESGKQIRREKKTNGARTPLMPKEDKKGLNEPQTTIFHLLTDKIGCK